MDFVAVLDQVITLLRQRGRVTYSTLKRQFQLDDAAVEDVKNELIEGQRLAVDERGNVLVWMGDARTAPPGSSTPVEAPVRAPLTYTPPYLAEKILTSKSALEGERKQVTVLFADLKGSMELLADRDPEEARQLLDPVLERMMAAVHRYEGTVNQVMGDGIMALFGAPLAHEDHAVRACYAALAMQEAMRRYSAEVRRTHGVEVQSRVGLNSGEVVVRAIGNDLHMDYSAVGQTTHLAARMEQLATPGSIRLTATTLRLVEGLVHATHVKNVPGRKTDKAAARWLAKRMRFGLLPASFIPPQGQRDLRDLTRYRTKLVQERVREVNRVQGVLERANIKLASVIAAIMGVAGRAMLEARIAGRADPAAMAALAQRRMRSKIPLIEQALTGVVHAHHRQLLAMQLAHIDVLDEQIDALNQAIEASLKALSVDVPPGEGQTPLRTSQSVAPSTVSPPLTFTRAVELWDTIPGVDQRGAEVIVAESGTDRSRFETAPRLAAWAGVAPGNDESAGTQRSGNTRQGNRPLRAILTQLAHAAVRTKATSLSALYQRLAVRRGKKRAIIAVAHSIMRSVFPMLSRHARYRELGANYFDERRRQFTVDRLTRRIEHLGYHVHLEPVVAPAA